MSESFFSSSVHTVPKCVGGVIRKEQDKEEEGEDWEEEETDGDAMTRLIN